MKKFFIAFAALVTLLFTGTVAYANEISGAVRLWTNEKARQFLQGNGAIPAGETDFTNYDQVLVTLKDSTGAVVNQMLSGNGVATGEFRFQGLADGTYTVEIANENTFGIKHDALLIPDNTSANGGQDIYVYHGEPYQVGPKATVTITNGQPVEHIYFAVVHHPYAVELTTSVGAYYFTDAQGNEYSRQSFPQYSGGVNYFEYSGRLYATNMGVLATDSLNTGYVNDLPTPQLTQEQHEFGYTFAGWLANASMKENYPELFDANGTPVLMSTAEVLNIKAKGDMSFKAVFKYPINRVIFATDIEKGSLNGGASVQVDVEGANKVVADGFATLPTPEVKDGYEFIGWYADETTNVIDNDTISRTNVNGTLTYYAKYRVKAPTVAIDPNTNTWIINGKDTGVVATGPAGKDGQDGKDGQTASVAISQAGFWIINGVDTGVPATGPAGKDAHHSETTVKVSRPVQTQEVYQKGGLLPKTGSETIMTIIFLIGALLLGVSGYFLGRRQSEQ